LKLTTFWASDFRSLREVRLDGLGAFNVFYGPNGSGKSNVLAGMRTLFSLLACIKNQFSPLTSSALDEPGLRASAEAQGKAALGAGLFDLRDLRVGSSTGMFCLGMRCEARPDGSGGVDTSLSIGNLIPESVTLELTVSLGEPRTPLLYLSKLEIDDRPHVPGSDLASTPGMRVGFGAFLGRLAAQLSAVEAVRGPQMEKLEDVPSGEDPVRYHLGAGRLKNAFFYAKNSGAPKTRERFRRLREFLQGPPLLRPELDTVLDPSTRALDLREPIPGGDVSLDLAGLGIAQIYSVLAGVVLPGSGIVSIEEPEAHLYAPSSGRHLAALLRRCVEEGIVEQLHIATHSNLFDLDPTGYWDVSLVAGETRVERKPLDEIDRLHLFEPGPAKHQLQELLRLYGDEVVFRDDAGRRWNAKEMLVSLQRDDDVARAFLQTLHAAALQVTGLRARRGQSRDPEAAE
jgi:hypothetical protein